MRRKKINQLKQFEQQQLEIHREKREAATARRQRRKRKEKGTVQRKKSNLKEILINELRLKQQEQAKAKSEVAVKGLRNKGSRDKTAQRERDGG